MSISQAAAAQLAGIAIDAGAAVAKAIAEGKTDAEITAIALQEAANYRAVEAVANERARAKYPDFRGE